MSSPTLSPSGDLIGAQSLQRSFPTARTISALVLREMTTRFGRTPGGFLWALLQPLATIIILGMAFSLLARSPALGTSFILFKATGMMPFQTFRSNSTMVGGSISYSRSLLMYPGVTWVDALLARFILNTLVMIVVTALILVGIVVVQGVTLIMDWNAVILSMALSAFLGLGVGTLNCFLTERIEIWSRIWQILNAPLMILSGVLMLPESLPTDIQYWLYYNPLIHLTGLMRQGFYSTYQPQYVSITYVLLWSMIPLMLGLILLRRYHRELINR
ncbi:MAG: ABC transporter permease [Rhodobacter sp.]|nr:ABC transporter permease [Paracoccaceae bacterium]MCB1409851.1 ABC transporter permease [Paracoccaceae bacterium]MCC0081299.1 ABC transporter permease [Rhodobacter sp.]